MRTFVLFLLLLGFVENVSAQQLVSDSAREQQSWQIIGGHLLEFGYVKQYSRAESDLPGSYDALLEHYHGSIYYSAGIEFSKGGNFGIALDLHTFGASPDREKRAEAMLAAFSDQFVHFDYRDSDDRTETRKFFGDMGFIGADVHALHFAKVGPFQLISRAGLGVRIVRLPTLEVAVRPRGSNLFDIYEYSGKRSWAPALSGGISITHPKVRVLQLAIKGSITRHQHETEWVITENSGTVTRESFKFKRTYPILQLGLTLHFYE